MQPVHAPAVAQAPLAVTSLMMIRLNGGPGAPAFLYIRRHLQEQLINPITGWMGQKNLFQFESVYQPATGLRQSLEHKKDSQWQFASWKQ